MRNFVPDGFSGFYGAILTAVVTVAIAAWAISSGASSETNQMSRVEAQNTQTGNGNNFQVGDGNVSIGGQTAGSIVNNFEIIIQSEIAASGLELQLDQAELLSRVLSDLAQSGDLEISEEGVRALARSAADIITSEPLQENIIDSREFWLERGKTYNLFNSGTFVAYLKNCSRVGHVAVSVGDVVYDCVNNGSVISVEIDGQLYAMRYVQQERDGRVSRAMFSISGN